MADKNLLIIGGTGIVGAPIALEGLARAYKVYVVTLETADLPKEISQIVVDRTNNDFSSVIRDLHNQVGHWEAVIDAFVFDGIASELIHSLFAQSAKHVITISTTLVYDRSEPSHGPISEEQALAQPGVFGGYVDGKLSVELFWQGVTDVPWTILRPYHILGAGSLLGCIPEHNRDPLLLDKIANQVPLRLCNGGDIKLMYIHPVDIARAIFALVGKEQTFGQAYNLVYPEVILAQDYYEEIARQLGKKLVIGPVSIKAIWQELKGWEMTTFPHIYTVNKIQKDTGFIATIPLAEAIKDAIAHYPQITTATEEIPIHQRMNKLPRPRQMDWLIQE